MKCKYLYGIIFSLLSACGSSDMGDKKVLPKNYNASIKKIINELIANNETVEIVISDQQTSNEVYAAYLVRARIDRELWYAYGVTATASILKRNGDITDAFDKNRIFIGLESGNAFVADLRSSLLDQNFRKINYDTGRVEGYKFYTGKKGIVVTGKRENDYINAAFGLSEYGYTIGQLRVIEFDGSIVDVTGQRPFVQTNVLRK